MPLSRDPEKRKRQELNLVKAPPAPPGNARAVRHGGYAAVARERLEAKVLEVFDAVGEDLPLRDRDGGVPRADTVTVRLLAEALCRLDDVSANVRDYGYFDQKTGAVRPAVELEGRLRKEAADYLDALGMTPRSRAKLGADLTRAVDLATAMSEPDPDRRAQLMREANVPLEEGDDDGD